MTTLPMSQEGGEWNFQLSQPRMDALPLADCRRNALESTHLPTYPFFSGLPGTEQSYDFPNVPSAFGKYIGDLNNADTTAFATDPFALNNFSNDYGSGEKFKGVEGYRQQQTSAMPEPSMQIELCDKDLWDQFSKAGTEMIVTKNGRRMFPGYRIKISGLDPQENYCVMMDIVNVDDHRYKFQHGDWTIAGRGEPHLPQRFFLHPNSPATGAKWMNEIVSFHKVKLTNSVRRDVDGMIVLNSMHRYQPRIHIVRADEVSRIHMQHLCTYAFPQTVFITVTAYQNPEVTKLKISNNPFAKGFREDGARAKVSKDPRCEASDRNLYSTAKPELFVSSFQHPALYGTPAGHTANSRSVPHRTGSFDSYSNSKRTAADVGLYNPELPSPDFPNQQPVTSNLFNGNSGPNGFWQPAFTQDILRNTMNIYDAIHTVGSQQTPSETQTSNTWSYDNHNPPVHATSPGSINLPITETLPAITDGHVVPYPASSHNYVTECPGIRSFGRSSDSGLGSSPPTSPEEESHALKPTPNGIFSPANL